MGQIADQLARYDIDLIEVDESDLLKHMTPAWAHRIANTDEDNLSLIHI